MWFKKFLAYLRFKYLLHTTRKLSPRKPNRHACETLINQLNIEFFKDYQPTVGLGTVFTTPYTNIDEYTQKIKELNRYVKEERYLPPDWMKEEESTITVDRFLTSSEGYYLYVPQAVSQFKEAALRLCILMKESDTAEHGVYEHNLRMLTKLFINLRTVTGKLMEISLINERAN